MPKMTLSEQHAFLREPGILMRIATVREDGSPLVTPIWFLFEDGCLWFTPRKESDWFACLKKQKKRCAKRPSGRSLTSAWLTPHRRTYRTKNQLV